MKVGEHWGFRKSSRPAGNPLHPVEILAIQRGRTTHVAVRHLSGPECGAEVWTTKARLPVLWEAAAAYLHDEIRFERVRAASCFVYRTTELRAAVRVIGADIPVAGYQDIMLITDDDKNAGVIVIPDLALLAASLGWYQSFFFADPLAFTDRFGRYFGPSSIALAFVQRIAATFPDRMLLDVRRREWRIGEGMRLENGNRRLIAVRLEQKRNTLIRSWCGMENAETYINYRDLAAEVEYRRALIVQWETRPKDWDDSLLGSELPWPGIGPASEPWPV